MHSDSLLLLADQEETERTFLSCLLDLMWDSNLCRDKEEEEREEEEEVFHVKWHGPQTPSAVCQAGEHSVQQSALVRVMAAARGNTSGRWGLGGGWLRRKYQLPIVRLVTFSVILLPLRRETHRAAGRRWNNAALLENTPRVEFSKVQASCGGLRSLNPLWGSSP